MKLIRLTDDRYILDAGPDIRADHLAMLRDYWEDWWEKNPGEIPTVFTIGGIEMPLEYEDRRDADIEVRVTELERRVRGIEQREPA